MVVYLLYYSVHSSLAGSRQTCVFTPVCAFTMVLSRQLFVFAIALALLLAPAAAKRPTKEQLIVEFKKARDAIKNPKLNGRHRASGVFLDHLIPQLETNWNPTDAFLDSANGKTILLPEDTAIGSAGPGALYNMMKPDMKRQEVRPYAPWIRANILNGVYADENGLASAPTHFYDFGSLGKCARLFQFLTTSLSPTAHVATFPSVPWLLSRLNARALRRCASFIRAAMQVAAHCGAVRFTCQRLTCRDVEPTLAPLSWCQNQSPNPRSTRFRITRARNHHAPTRVASQPVSSDGRLPARRRLVGVVPFIAVVERRIHEVARRRAIHRTAVHAATDARFAPHAAFTGVAATRGAALARIDSSISLPLAASLPVRRYAAPPFYAARSAAIAAVEGAEDNAAETAVSSPPSPSPSPESSPSSSADASASSAAPASAPPQGKRQYAIGALQQLPAVSPATEIIGTALRRAKHVRASKGIMNAAKRERSKGAQQLDCLTKEISGPLGRYVRLFPRRSQLHPFERSLVELTLGDGVYEEVLSRVDALRKRVLDVGKNAASLVNKTNTVKEAEQATAQGMAQVEDLYTRNSHVVEPLKEITKRLRAIPVVRPDLPTLCLVGAPNVGKSSLVRAISSGKPEVCNYPFTTRGISMGHFYVDGQKHQ
ncbi:unnamed protein product, partial [Closterium sp. Yama58-4]